VTETFELPHHDRRALRLRKLPKAGHQSLDLLALLGQLCWADARGVAAVELESPLGLVPNAGQRRVADDPVEPGTELDLLVGAT
jgi:hypothetical protein